MKKFFALLLAVSMVMGLVACGGDTSSDPGSAGSSGSGGASSSSAGTGEAEYTIRYSHSNSEGSLVYMVSEFFAETLQEKTGGRIAVEIYPSGQLSSGDDEAMLNLMGNVYEMSPSAPSSLAKYSNLPQFNILDFPYLFDSVDESQALIESDLWKEVEQQFEENTNCRPLFWYSTGSNAVGNSKRAVDSPDDLNGLKLRAAQSDYFVETLNVLGAAPIAMAFGETFTAVQQGTVDGIMTPFVNFWKEGFYEVTPYVTQLQSSEFYHCLMISSDYYNSLPDDLRALFDEAVAETKTYALELGKEFEEVTVPENLIELGTELVQLTDEQKAAFKEATAPARESLKDSVGTDFYNSVVEFLES